MLLLATSALAGPPDGATIMREMKVALEPPQSSLRKLKLVVTAPGIPGPQPATSTVVLGQARGTLADADRVLTVVLAPPDLRGMAYLVQQQAASGVDVQWAYIPAIGRVRTLMSPEAFSAFLNSDFTYSDLGFISLRPTYTVKGEDTAAGTKVYRVDAVPKEHWYYSHIETLVTASSSMPVAQKFFDPAGALWKVARYQGAVTVDGVPTVVEIAMDDVQAKSTSVLTVTDLDYGAKVPDGLLTPDGLVTAASSPVWNALAAPVKR